jgi:hypothetical protein
MTKDATLFMRINKVEESKIYVIGQGDVECRHDNIVDVYHVPNISVNLLYVA